MSSAWPGANTEPSPWGELPLVIDTSAWARVHRPAAADHWAAALRAGRVRMPPMVRFEILFAARHADQFDALTAELDALRPAPLTAGVLRAAEAAMRALALRSAGAQRLPLVDYLVAAAAQEIGAAVLHYDRDYDTLAEVLDFESVWLAPPGTLP